MKKTPMSKAAAMKLKMNHKKKSPAAKKAEEKFFEKAYLLKHRSQMTAADKKGNF